MTRRVPLRAAPLVAAALALVVSLTGCGAPADLPPTPTGIDLRGADARDGNGLWLRSGSAVTDIVAEAVRTGGPVRISGEITETVQPEPDAEPRPGRTLTLDFRGTASAFAATVRAGDVRIDAVVSADGSRVKGNAAFARQYAGREAGAVVCTSGLDPVLLDVAPLLEPAGLVSALLGAGGVGANPPVGDAETLDVVTGEEGSVVGVLTVERFGPPLPRSFVAADASGEGALEFSAWGEPVDLDAAAAELPCDD
jgi:hypothetical protein